MTSQTSDRRKLRISGILRRAAALLLATVTLLTPALAADTFNAKAFLQELSDADIGDTVFFGAYEQDNKTSNGKEPIEWIVLDKESDRVLLLSKKSLDYRQVDSTNPMEIGLGEGTIAYRYSWSLCELRQWLNGTFLDQAFSSAEQELLCETIVRNSPNYYDFSAGSDTLDKAFLLSMNETENYFPAEKDRIAQATQYAQNLAYEKSVKDGYPLDKKALSQGAAWWLREKEIEYYFFTVDEAGRSSDSYSMDYMMVRPAIWVGLTSRSRTVKDTSDMYIEPPASNTPCAEDLRQISADIVCPKASSYLPYYEMGYVQLQKGAANAYRRPQAAESSRRPYTVEDGTFVYIAARENGLSCIIFTQEVNGKEVDRVCWINSKWIEQ